MMGWFDWLRSCDHVWEIRYYCRNQEEASEPMLVCTKCGDVLKEPNYNYGDRQGFEEMVAKVRRNGETSKED